MFDSEGGPLLRLRLLVGQPSSFCWFMLVFYVKDSCHMLFPISEAHRGTEIQVSLHRFFFSYGIYPDHSNQTAGRVVGCFVCLVG